MEKLIVQKFSGKVMQDVTTRQLAIRQVKEVLATGHRVIAVVSAPKGPAQPYATASLEKLVGGDFSALQPRELAQLVGTGEVIAMSLMVNEMRQQGLNVVGLTGPQAGIYTNEHYQKAQIACLDKQPIEQAFAAAAQVVVVAGFQGQNAAGQLTTLEVGGSDITAAVLAAAFGAQRLDLFVDVSPAKALRLKQVTGPTLTTTLTYQQLVHSAGAQVIHPQALSIVQQAALPLRLQLVNRQGEATWTIVKPA